MKNLFQFSLLSILFLFAWHSVAETLPLRGESMAGIEARFGKPDSKRAPVGNPPITSWVYSSFTVYFESNMVLHAVSNNKQPMKRKAAASSQASDTKPAESPYPEEAQEEPVFDATTARGFFDQYVYLLNKHDLAVLEPYADDAKIITDQKTDDGVKRAFELDGRKWKMYVERAMPGAIERNVETQFTNIHVTHNGIESTIKADRYQNAKCYNDTDYYMKIKRNNDNEYKIIEEYFRTWPAAKCE